MTTLARHHLSFGAELLGPDRTRFRLWAPSAASVAVVIPDRANIEMNATDEGWFEAEVRCGAGTRYRYRVQPLQPPPAAHSAPSPLRGEGRELGREFERHAARLHNGIRLQADAHPARGSENAALPPTSLSANFLDVPDPASRAQDGDVHDASIVIDPDAYAWRCAQWRGRPWHETVLYELHVGIAGGFAAAAKRLPALAALGVTAIELMPVADFPGARNWGYDGVLPFAPDAAYGTPDDLKAFVDAAHVLELMVFLDVVYNHFGPDGNFVHLYADPFFRDDINTPWGRAIDFRRREVRDFYCENALYWLSEYRVDGLRLDATHSIVPQDWLIDLAACVQAAFGASRHVHLVLEHEGNAARLLAAGQGYAAQWNDDGHHVLHVLLTGEADGYYIDYAKAPADELARCLAEGFIYQGQPSTFRSGEARGEPSKDLPTTAFVLFLQNHDQIGNRAFGERLTTLADPDALRAASALVLLAPQIPLLFMGEEWGAREPFLYFTSYADAALAAAVRQGRRNEFAGSNAFADARTRDAIPDPNDLDTFTRSVPDETADALSLAWFAHTHDLLALRHAHIVPRLVGARSLGAEAVGPAAVVARWHMGDGAVLSIATNLASSSVEVAAHRFHQRGDVLYATSEAAAYIREGILPARSTWALIEAAR